MTTVRVPPSKVLPNCLKIFHNHCSNFSRFWYIHGVYLYSDCAVNAASQCSMYERTERYIREKGKETGSLLIKVLKAEVAYKL